MIINVRGNGGSGKSTVVKAVMARYVRVTPEHVAGRQRPFGYLCENDGHAPLYVPGHYETPCGGCDTIMCVSDVFQRITNAALDGCDVLFEGIIAQDAVADQVCLAAVYGLRVLCLDVPLEVCLQSIAVRRQARQDQRPLNPTNTTRRQRAVTRGASRLAEAGVPVTMVDRVQCEAMLVAWLGLPAYAAELEVVRGLF